MLFLNLKDDIEDLFAENSFDLNIDLVSKIALRIKMLIEISKREEIGDSNREAIRRIVGPII